MIKTIVFDFGGVIFDLDRDGAVQAFKRIGLSDADVRLDKYHQRGIFQLLEEGRLTPDQFKAQLEPLCGRALTHAEVQRAWMGYVGSPVDKRKLDYLDDLRRRGYGVMLLSNTNPYVQEWADSESFTPWGRTLGSYMDRLFLSFQMGVMKPDPRIFRMMLDDAGLVPEETLFIDDGQSNVDAACELGIKAINPGENADWRELVERAISS